VERWHGTLGGYTNHHCRCDRCLEAHRVYQREQSWRSGRRRPMADYLAELPPRTHGIRATYTKGCRCEPCRQAERDYRRVYRARV
jgi:hypothetical protein